MQVYVSAIEIVLQKLGLTGTSILNSTLISKSVSCNGGSVVELSPPQTVFLFPGFFKNASERHCSFYFQKQTPASAFPGNFAFCLNLLHFASCESERNTRCYTSRCKRKPTPWMVLAVTRHCSLLPLGYV